MSKAAPSPTETLARFGARLLDLYTDTWDYGDLDGSYVNDIALDVGVLVQREEKHPDGECEACSEFDAPCVEIPDDVLQKMHALTEVKK